MAWCHEATSHYLNQCWPSSVALLVHSEFCQLFFDLVFQDFMWCPFADSTMVDIYKKWISQDVVYRPDLIVTGYATVSKDFKRLSALKHLSDFSLTRAGSRFAPSQWETVLLCNDVSHWLGANLKSALLTPLHLVTLNAGMEFGQYWFKYGFVT